MSTTIAEPVVARAPRPGPSPIVGALNVLASLKLTVWLFSFSLFLVLVGTLAQVDEGVWTVVDRYFRSMFVLVPFKLFFPRSMNVPGVFPFFGGWLLGAALLVNLLAAHLVRFRLTWKRSGILIIHSGITVLLLSELIAGLYQVEARMTIGEGETVNYVELSRRIELAFTDSSKSDHDTVVTIPGSMLKAGATIKDDRLPVDIEVNGFWPNSQIVDADRAPSARDKWKSITGDEWTIVEQKPGSGVEVNQAEDAATARLTFKDKKTGQVVGSPTVSLYFHPNFVLRQKRLAFAPQKVTVDGKPFTFELRPVREYKPYALKLYEFRHDKYLGTDTPKNFSSKVQVHEPDRAEDREVLISMNAPLRIYEGDPLLRKCETFYQQSFLPPELAGQRGTVLQVVRNPGWLMPYVACTLVAVGMLVHFVPMLVGFLSHDRSVAAKPMIGERTFGIATPLIAVMVCALFGAWVFRPERDAAGKLDLTEFGRLPVVADGRIKPLDTVARTSLLQVSEKQTFKDEKDVSQPAIQWLIDVYGSDDPFGGPGAKHRVFRIVDLELVSLLELPQRPLSWRYSLAEMQARYDRFEKELNRVQATKDEKRTPFDMAVLDLGKRLRIYEQLARRKTPLIVPPQGEGQEWRSVADADSAIVAPIAQQLHAQVTQDVIQRLRKDGVKIEELNKQQEALLELVIEKEFANKAAAYASANRAKAQPVASAVVNLMASARAGDGPNANALLREFQTSSLANFQDSDAQRIRVEYAFNRADVFYWLTYQYVFVFLFAGLSWVAWTQPLRRAALGLLIGTVILHTVALVVRMYLMDRPFVFVTNLYSSAIFIGWACAILGLGVELAYHNGVGSATAALTGALSLVVAHFLGLDGDQLQMLQAVLDTNFWLATHVTTVTLGYSATYLAGFFGVAYVVARLIHPNSSSTDLKPLSQMIYGTICFAMLFSFVGTVLGGIWADQSWGRFWGWDPKENGALMIVIWNALVLHARWAGLAKQRGVAILAIFGCVVTTWSWFGTNQLGVGLHSYGFTSGRTMAIVFTSLTFVGLGLVGLVPIGRAASNAPAR